MIQKGLAFRRERSGTVTVPGANKGARWVVAGGCCTPYSYHRGATLPINGTIHVAERYAIDFVRLNDKGAFFRGVRYGEGMLTPRMRAISRCSGRGRRSDGISAVTARGR